MDKRAIENYSNTVREKLREEIGDRLSVLGFTRDEIFTVDTEYEDSIVVHGRVFDKKIKKQRAELEKQVREKGFSNVVDEVTYTWFNRFTALKFMEANRYLPVLPFSSGTKGKDEPDILGEALEHSILRVDRDRVLEFKEKGEDEKLYKYLLLQLCRYLHRVMPFLFEDIEDYTELLFPERLLHTDSIIHDLNDIIPTQDWEEVEIIGWIYQFYVAERKDRVFSDLKKNIKIRKEDIPAATQLFTPKWIVKYMVENSLGRLWVESNPDGELVEGWKYFIGQEATGEKANIRDPEEITVLDPAMGSGHILVYALEVLYEIYRSQGYLESEIAPLILNKNLYGLEIDDRATQLAGFAVMMKARAYDADLFDKDISLNLVSIQETGEEFPLDSAKYPEISKMWNFYEDAKIYGSILKAEDMGLDWEKLEKETELLRRDGSLESFDVMKKMKQLKEQTEVMTRKYDCVITNPPYMGSKGMGKELKDYLKKNYKISKQDLFAVFIEKCLELTAEKRFTAMITMQSWMFLSSFEDLRNKIVNRYIIDTMVHLGPKAFEEIGGEVVNTTTFVLRNEKPGMEE